MRCIEWRDDHIEIIDQTRLPAKCDMIRCYDIQTLGEAIKRLSIRGAPALGIAAAMGIALTAIKSDAKNKEQLLKEIEETGEYLASTRPTAVNLFWAIKRMTKKAEAMNATAKEIKEALLEEALKIFEEDRDTCKAIGKHGAELVKDGFNILHHCNTGFLATGDFGTALGVIRAAHEQGKKIHVWVDETRPLLQGSRLTAWELQQEGIPYSIIADNMAAWLMARGKVDMIVLGADRIAANGDVANKIGTYSLAVLAKYHNVPFYSAAPRSTIDMEISSGKEIVIEQRKKDELIYFQGAQSAPTEAQTYNPAFDVTPTELITGIITEYGVITPPYKKNLTRLFEGVAD